VTPLKHDLPAPLCYREEVVSSTVKASEESVRARVEPRASKWYSAEAFERRWETRSP